MTESAHGETSGDVPRAESPDDSPDDEAVHAVPVQRLPPPPPTGLIVKRSILYGTAIGLIAGLVDRAIRGDAAGEVAAIIRWRQFLIAGAVIGGTFGLFIAWLARGIWRRSSSGPQQPTE